MKWILVIILYQGSVNWIPMDNQAACQVAAAKLSSMNTRTVCITQD